MLRAELEAAGLDPESVEVSEVTTEAEAERRRFPGSPTVRVNGSDIDPGGAGEQPFGLTCRVYRRADGRVSPLPDPGCIRAALQAAIEGTRDE